MNVYGIDTLFYSEKRDLLMFGEAKFSKNLNNGIKLIKESLKDYEKQLRQEYVCVLSKRIYKGLLNKFNDLYGDKVAISTSMDMFVKKSGISEIGIPIFIAHGEDVKPEEIIKPIEALYFTNSKHKKMLLDLGIYERDINPILKIIGDNFVDAVELRERLINNKGKFNKLSFLSRYVIERLVGQKKFE